jgi:hypothetical protein
MNSILERFRTSKTEGRHNDHERALARPALNVHARRATYVVTSSEQALCTCPEFCERDHENE